MNNYPYLILASLAEEEVGGQISTLPFGFVGGSQETFNACGPAAETVGGGWFCGGAEAVRNDSGDVEVHPPEEHTCGRGRHPVSSDCSDRSRAAN